MDRVRGLTQAERWELGLLLVMLCVACLTLAVIVKQYSLPEMMAVDARGEGTSSPTGGVPVTVSAVRKDGAGGGKSKFELPLTDAMPAPIDVPYVVEEPLVIEERPAALPVTDYKYYGGQKYRYVRTVRLQVTAYAPDARCCWPYDGTTTASGLSVKTNGGKLVAADTSLIPMHSLVSVKGYAGGSAVPVLDRGSAIKGHRLDVLLPTFEQARQWGTRAIEVKVYERVK